MVEVDDTSEWAGWVFADMLVGLMVVFLATITFVTAGAGVSTNGSTSNSYTYTQHFQQQFTAIYESDQAGQVSGDIKGFLKNNNLPANAVVVSATFVGAVPQGSSNATGVATALAFSKALDAASPKLLKDASTVLNSSTDLAPGRVAVVFEFSANVSTK